PLSPLSSWHSDQTFGLVAGLMIWLGVGLAVGLTIWLVTRTGFALLVCLFAGLVIGLLAGLVYPQSWPSTLAFAQLAMSDRTPVRLMRFLEDAHARGVLRTVGPVYQFRHARLQDRLVGPEQATGQAGKSRPTAE